MKIRYLKYLTHYFKKKDSNLRLHVNGLYLFQSNFMWLFGTWESTLFDRSHLHFSDHTLVVFYVLFLSFSRYFSLGSNSSFSKILLCFYIFSLFLISFSRFLTLIFEVFFRCFSRSYVLFPSVSCWFSSFGVNSIGHSCWAITFNSRF